MFQVTYVSSYCEELIKKGPAPICRGVGQWLRFEHTVIPGSKLLCGAHNGRGSSYVAPATTCRHRQLDFLRLWYSPREPTTDFDEKR